jgi:hypothetical protein
MLEKKRADELFFSVKKVLHRHIRYVKEELSLSQVAGADRPIVTSLSLHSNTQVKKRLDGMGELFSSPLARHRASSAPVVRPIMSVILRKSAWDCRAMDEWLSPV